MMDPLPYQEILDYSHQGSKLQVSINNGNVIMVPVEQLSEAQSSPDSLSQHITTRIISSEQLQQASPIEQANFHQTSGNMYDSSGLGGVDDNLTDLQPEGSDEEEEEHVSTTILTAEQQKLEFMAAVNLVPPAVLEEIQRRQKLCRAEYGNWWDRQHSTDFCLVPKTSSALNKLHNISEDNSTPVYHEETTAYPLLTAGGSEDQTQVAADPDAESTVEQITYLTSWPASNSSSEVTSSSQHHGNTVEVVTTPSLLSGHAHHQQSHQQPHSHYMTGGSGLVEDGGYQITFQSMNDYSTSNRS